MGQYSFQEVMKQWARMCYSFRCLPNGCSGCPLVHERCYHEMPYRMDISIIEGKVMAWAAEHPEPVYPTWREWLIKLGIISFEADFHSLLHSEPNTLTNAVKAYLNEEGSKPIPADIAQKLGIEPKEG